MAASATLVDVEQELEVAGVAALCVVHGASSSQRLMATA
jgi:hypothetical protein